MSVLTTMTLALLGATTWSALEPVGRHQVLQRRLTGTGLALSAAAVIAVIVAGVVTSG